MKKEVFNDCTSLAKIEVQNNEPTLYQVMMHNDDYTPMDFVVDILERFFYMDRHKAMETMMAVHQTGKAICGVFTKEVAESKISQIVDYARVHEHPLICSMEAAS